MQTRTTIGGLLLALGILSAGCGGTIETAPKGAAQRTGQTGQALDSNCAPGYTEQQVWECDYGCGLHTGLALHDYCSSATGTYDLGIIDASCDEYCN